MHIAAQHRVWILLLCGIGSVGCGDEEPARMLRPFMEDASLTPDANLSVDSSYDAGADMGAPDAGEGDAEPDSGVGEGCGFNGDGVIDREEFPIVVGLGAPYLVGSDSSFDTRGDEMDPLTWDFEAEQNGDRRVQMELQASNGWWAEHFSEATYVSRLSAEEEVLGVFRATDSALLLLGLVSVDEGLLATRLTYDPPVTVLQFPLELGVAWETDSTVSGPFGGVLSLFNERYTSQVDKVGVARTPYADFEVLRVNTELVRTVGFLTTVIRTQLFVTECFGTVAMVRSQDNETESEFALVSEIRRLSP